MNDETRVPTVDETQRPMNTAHEWTDGGRRLYVQQAQEPAAGFNSNSDARLLAAELLRLRAERDEARARERDLLALLKRLEWSGKTAAGQPCCPVCGSTMLEEGQHTDDCELSSALLSSPDAQKAAGELESLRAERDELRGLLAIQRTNCINAVDQLLAVQKTIREQREICAREATRATVAETAQLALRAKLTEWEEREAACCPEDVGFPEYIARLRKQIEMYQKMMPLSEEVRDALLTLAEIIGVKPDHKTTAMEICVAAGKMIETLRTQGDACRTQLVEARAASDRLEGALGMREATLAMTVARLGGQVEGAPTHRGNFLQRIDELRRIEADVARLRIGAEQAGAAALLLPMRGPLPERIKALRKQHAAELEGSLEIMTRERDHFARDNVALRTRLNAVDALLASEEVPEGLVDAVANEVTPDTAAQTAWRWFREQLRAPVYVGVDLASKPDFTVERIAAAPPAEPQEES